MPRRGGEVVDLANKIVYVLAIISNLDYFALPTARRLTARHIFATTLIGRFGRDATCVRKPVIIRIVTATNVSHFHADNSVDQILALLMGRTRNLT